MTSKIDKGMGGLDEILEDFYLQIEASINEKWVRNAKERATQSLQAYIKQQVIVGQIKAYRNVPQGIYDPILMEKWLWEQIDELESHLNKEIER